MIPIERVTHWLTQLVNIPSVNPDGGYANTAPEHLGEGRIAQFLADTFRRFAGEVEEEFIFPDRPNVYGMWHGRPGSDEWVAVDVHVDTVAVSQMTDPPFDGRIENGRLWGRGAVDTKATLGILLALIEEVAAGTVALKHNLLVAATIGEEAGGFGAKALAEWVPAKGLNLSQMIVAEPTLCVPVYAHKGVTGMQVRVEGEAAHSSTPHLGKNAITAAAQILTAIDAENTRLQSLKPRTDAGNPTIAVTLIDGGAGHNIIPNRCDITINRRNVPFETVDEIVADLTTMIQASCDLPVTVLRARGAGAFYQNPDTAWVQQMAKWSGSRPEAVPYGTNALAYPGMADETLIFGPGSIDQAHGAVEWVTLAELEKAAEVYANWLLD